MGGSLDIRRISRTVRQARCALRARWQNLRQSQLLREDVRELTRIQEIDQLLALASLLASRSGQQVVYASLARKSALAKMPSGLDRLVIGSASRLSGQALLVRRGCDSQGAEVVSKRLVMY